jgi:hypothetical protein
MFSLPSTQQGVCHIGPLPFALKSILMKKKDLWKLKYFTMQKYNLQKKSSKRKPKILSRYILLQL